MWQAQVRVDLDAIRHNVATLRDYLAPGTRLMTVVKADAYGHGMLPVARAALQAGADWLGVATLDEAITLRDAGITAPVLAWLHSPDRPLHDAIERDIDLSAASIDGLLEITQSARKAKKPAKVHLKIDTGLSRGGAAQKDWPALLERAAKAAGDGDAEIKAVWSHLACADEPGHPSTARQLAAFHDALEAAERHGIRPELRHLANSAATLTLPETHFDLVRVGLSTYGLSPIEGAGPDLRPAMSVHARVALVKEVPVGEGVSYGHTYKTLKDTTLALVPLGYGDGVPRAASSRGPIWLAGKVRRIVGRVCMDQVVVDCGDDEVRPGDEAILIQRGGPTADDWALACDTINYEIVTRMGSARTPRIYVGERT
ncbi:alanine racemase [Dactylosporangium sp. AC04546]|uniref:alanine racemase n=1 Tax=Dactylosporangium sp. AC04546 TaxID=2862460 RepID=UPI001EE12036|nr:alanine racemase [Dactylosporangium sp. AC04546]WVK83160.1 alanine racemase [Dactylosporangium sp. AC04546]